MVGFGYVVINTVRGGDNKHNNSNNNNNNNNNVWNVQTKVVPVAQGQLETSKSHSEYI
jgi:hypothetical protein